MATEWLPEFETVVRRHLPLLDANTPITPDLALADHGLNSLAMIRLLVDLEDGFGVEFPDDVLAATAFRTAGALWTVLNQVLAA